jgi:tetratricopeptide (TPR) repeat protein
MNDDWKELSTLLDTALELPPEARAGWLESLQVRDPALKERLRALLARGEQVETNDFMRALPRLALTQLELAALQPGEKAGDIVGAYRLVRELGSGGMSSVWLAERVDGLINRPVALKLPQGLWRRGALAERFARERQMLAALTHPGIARLYDTGVSASGQPYLALEYVEGKPIDVFCDDCGAGVRDRVRLCLQVARAVAFAHSRLIVHRDLKPANILVTGEGEVRLLDFGIAKLLDPEHQAERTEISQLAFTPDYASPEQIAGGAISTASDVYSLGVVMYELLTGRKPYTLARGNRAALEQAVLSAAPPKPSAVVEPAERARELRGDLDTILLKALKKSPEERYPSVAALADDLERYLTHRPVLARADSVGYRVRKFVWRNKLAVGAAASILVVILAGAGVALWQAQVARAEAERAEEFREFLASTIRDADPRLGEGKVLSAADLLRQARGRTELLNARPEIRVEMLSLISSSLLNLEDFAGAEDAAREALAEGEKSLGPDHPLTLRARMAMIGVHRFRGRVDDMRRELAAVEKTLAETGQSSVEQRFLVLESHGHLAIDAGDSALAVKSAKQALDLARGEFGEKDPRTAAAAILLAEAYEYSDATPETALKAAERGFQMTQAIHGGNDRHPQIITARDVYGRALCRGGRMDEGLAQLERALADGIEVLGPNSATVAFLSGNIALYQRQRGRIHEAIANFDRALDIHARNVSKESFTYLTPLSGRGGTHLVARQAEPALADLQQAATGLRKLFGPEHEETVIAEWNRALALAYLGRFEESKAAFEQPLAAYRGRYKEPLYLPYRALVAAATGRRLAGDFEGAKALIEEALASFGPEAKVTRQYIVIFNELGFIALGQNRPGDALLEFEKSLALFLDPDKPLNPVQADTFLGLGRAHLALHHRQEAITWLQRANAWWLGFDAGNAFAREAAAWLARAKR